MARTVVLIQCFNDAKELFADSKGREHEIIRVFCATKCLASWNAAEVGTTVRERCGGGGFLAYNRVAEVIVAGHSGMTAEGDNRVLMQKIVKDIIADSMKQRHRAPVMSKCPIRQIPKQESVTDLESLWNMIFFREVAELKTINQGVQQKMGAEGKKFYDIWMFEVSDNIQAVAQAYSERLAVESALANIAKCRNKETKDMLEKLLRLHCLALVRKDLGWYMVNGVIGSTKAAEGVETDFQTAVKEVVPYINDVLDGFDVPNIPQLYGPIARDYVKFNAQRDMENVEAAGQFLKGKL